MGNFFMKNGPYLEQFNLWGIIMPHTLLCFNVD